MTWARWVFWFAAALGFAAVYPLYYATGSPTYYGMIATLIAWQTAFVVIGVNPRRYRWLMIPAVLEKALWMVTLAVLYTKGQVDHRTIAVNAATHGLLGVLFLVAFVVTPKAEPPQ
ncbi:MAG TPA: hypothetical protein VN885_08970 [Candidatus Acidoferrales bacterium]|nr:hypothetical protein [Candidatus Acidoferrales bacterium]